ncbi:MAG: ParB/RepB/Spo0J family partition protein [Parasphingopyxis sp.]|uniref:ParB/RepB/Spo0J family partition protein n=1 Tax=Parasphingopyxis sp. TaxID=1920299 RepID=UPI003FA0DCC0
MTIKTIDIEQLRLSPLNVRKSKRRHIKALAEDIAAHGLIQNLVGYKNGKGYAVVAGSRRLEAIRLLKKQERLPKGFKVPLSICTKDEAIELSLAENQSRDDMHPADAIEAYGKLAADGMTSDDIAARFGVVPDHVNRILSLAGLHPDIRAALAKDEIGLEAAKAYTLTDDQEHQLRLFGEFGDNAHMVRRALTDDKIATDSAIFDLVPLAEYIEAGGMLTRDLFSGDEGGFADNPELVWRLAQQRMETIRDDYVADGWPEVEIAERQPENFYSLNHMRPKGLRDLTDKERERLAALEEKVAAIEEADPEAGVWNNDELRTIDEEVREIENARRLFTDEQKAESRVLIFVGYGGALNVQPISLRKAKRKKKDSGAKPERYSRKLCDAMHRIRVLAIREAMADNPGAALDMLITALIEDRLAYGVNSPLALRTRAGAVQVDDALLGDAKITDIEERADSVCAEIDRKRLCEAIAEMESETKMQLLATLVATLIDADSCLPGDIDERLGLDIGGIWQPSTAFFERMTKTAMLDLLSDECGTAAAANCRKLRKAALAEETARRLGELNWLPPMLQSSVAA